MTKRITKPRKAPVKRTAHVAVTEAVVTPVPPAPPPPTMVAPADLKLGMVVQDTSDNEPRMVVYSRPNNLYDYFIRTVDKNGKLQESQNHSAPLPVIQVDRTSWRTHAQNSTELLSRNNLHMTLGADPEIFVVDANDVVIPAFTFLPPKTNPSKSVRYDGLQFYDGFQAEWTTALSTGNPQCLSFHVDHVQDGMRLVLAAARAKNPDAKLSIASVVPIPRDMIHQYDERYFELGCSPSENVYGEEPLIVEDPKMLSFRSAGWHMHMGLGRIKDAPDTNIPKHKIHSAVRMMDAVLGVVGITFGQNYPYPERRTLYGRAGEYRYKTTLEYRVPEVLMGAHPATWNLLWDLGRMACWLGLGELNFLWDAEEDEVRHAINKSDVPVALKILKRNEVMLEKMLDRIYYFDPKSSQSTHTLDTIYGGIDEAVLAPTDVATNWYLNGDSNRWITHNGLSGTTWASACSQWERLKTKV
jgi:hypothetical protein